MVQHVRELEKEGQIDFKTWVSVSRWVGVGDGGNPGS